MVTTAAQFQENLIRERIRIRTVEAEELRDEYNRLQKKLNRIQEKVEFLVCENFGDQIELNKIIKENQNQ